MTPPPREPCRSVWTCATPPARHTNCRSRWGEIGLSDLASGRVTRVLDADLIRRTFNDEHELRYGFVHTDSVLEVGTLRIAIIGATVAMAGGGTPATQRGPARAPGPIVESTSVASGSKPLSSTTGDLAIGAVTSGPAIVEHSDTTIVVPTGWTLQRLPNRDLELAKEGSR